MSYAGGRQNFCSSADSRRRRTKNAEGGNVAWEFKLVSVSVSAARQRSFLWVGQYLVTSNKSREIKSIAEKAETDNVMSPLSPTLSLSRSHSADTA